MAGELDRNPNSPTYGSLLKAPAGATISATGVVNRNPVTPAPTGPSNPSPTGGGSPTPPTPGANNNSYVDANGVTQQGLPPAGLFPRTPGSADSGINRPYTASDLNQDVAGISGGGQLASQRQAIIESINQEFGLRVSNEQQAGNERETALNAELAAAGIMGGSTAMSSVSSTRGKTQDNINKIGAAKAAALSSALTELYKNDTETAKWLHDASMNDPIKSLEATQKLQEIQANAQDHFKTTASISTQSWEDFAAAHPDVAQKLLQQTNYDPFSAEMLWNSSKNAAHQIQYKGQHFDPNTNEMIMTGIDPTKTGIDSFVEKRFPADSSVGTMQLQTTPFNDPKTGKTFFLPKKLDPNKTLQEQAVFWDGGKLAKVGGTKSVAAGSTSNSIKQAGSVSASAMGVVAGHKIDPAISGDVEDVLSGRNTLLNIRQTMGRSNAAMAYMQKMRSAIKSVDPTFDFIASDAGGKLASSAFYQKSISAIDSVMPNINKITELSDQVSRLGVAGVDKLIQAGKIQIGDTKVANFHEAQKLISDEIGLALGQGSVSDMKLQLGFDVTDPSVSQEVFSSNMKLVKEFIQNRKNSLESQRYSSPTVSKQSVQYQPQSGDTVTVGGQDYSVDDQGNLTPIQ